MLEKPTFLQGVFSFTGKGLQNAVSFHPPVTYPVAADKRTQTIYFRAGNASEQMIYLVMTVGGKPMRYFPVGAKGAIHVPLAVVEDLSPGAVVEILIGAPQGLESAVVLDAGFLEFAE